MVDSRCKAWVAITLVLLSCSGGGSGDGTAPRELDEVCSKGLYRANDKAVVGHGITDDMWVVQLNEGGEFGWQSYLRNLQVLVAGEGALVVGVSGCLEGCAPSYDTSQIAAGGEPSWKLIQATPWSGGSVVWLRATRGPVYVLDLRGDDPQYEDGCM